MHLYLEALLPDEVGSDKEDEGERPVKRCIDCNNMS